MKPVLHFIPGTMCTERLWTALVAALEADFTCVHHPIPLAQDLDATVAALRAQLGAEPAWLVGFSLGAYLAACLAVRHPGAVSRLMLVSNTPCPLAPAEARQRAGILEWVDAHGYRGISRVKAASLVGDGAGREAIVETILAMDAQLGESVFKHQMRVTSERADLAAPLGALDIPVEFFFSRDDPLVDTAWLQRFGASSPRARLHPTDGRGHMLPLERPAELAALLRRWRP